PIRAAICRRSGSAWTAGEGWRGDSGRASALSSARQIPDHDFGIVPERDFSWIELSHGIYLRQRPGERYKFVCDDDSAGNIGIMTMGAQQGVAADIFRETTRSS